MIVAAEPAHRIFLSYSLAGSENESSVQKPGHYRQTVTGHYLPFFSQPCDQRFNEILAYTYSNYDEHICIDQVAKIANLTKESFCRYFKARARKTYMEFLNELRINKACQMIKRGDRTVKEISYSCGFDSLSSFYDRFKKIMKLSPLEFKYLQRQMPHQQEQSC